MPMQLPPPKVREVLSVLGDLNPAEARALLSEVVATLDAAELYALRTLLPPQATKFLPHAAGAVTVMNSDPMPWEFVAPAPVEEAKGPSTQEIIAATLAAKPKKPWVVSAVAIALTLATGWLAWPAARAPQPEPADELVALPPRPPVAAEPIEPLEPAARAPAPAAKPLPPKKARAAAPREKKLGPNEWASPFERRH